YVLSTLPRPPSFPLFPYTTLFRSIHGIYADTGALVRGGAVIANAQALNVSGLPADTHALLNEAVLLDTGSVAALAAAAVPAAQRDRKSTRLNSSHVAISYAVFGLK